MDKLYKKVTELEQEIAEHQRVEANLREAKEQLANLVAEYTMKLQSANMSLQEKLRQQSIRDPLTGLFNRLYLEESLEREIHQAIRHRRAIGVIMLDIDHFKRFNERYGNEAGDTLLRELGFFLKSKVRSGDIACRYGGEEFVLVLCEATLASTQQRAEQLREEVKHLQVQHQGQSLGRITLSFGLAAFPEHATGGVLQAAGAALQHAKAEGRDRVVVAESHVKTESP